jgi:hypothetical protein
MIAGALYLMAMSLFKVGGMGNLKAQFSYAVSQTTLFSNSTCGVPKSDYFDIVRDHKSDFPWTGGLTLFIIGVWYWCSE